MSDIKREPLGRFSINVSDDHTFGTDAVLLADFGCRLKVTKHCDLGTGCGIIPLLILKNTEAKLSTGVEIQTAAAELAKSNVELNNLEGRMTVLNADLKNIREHLPSGTFDLVTCNPPYNADGAGSKNMTEAQKIARHEVCCTLSDVIDAAGYLLKFGGRLCICHRPERLADIICFMREHKIEPKVLREVIQKQGKEPWLVLLEGRLGGKSGMQILPPLYVEKEGSLTDEMIEIYGDYKEGHGRKI